MTSVKKAKIALLLFILASAIAVTAVYLVTTLVKSPKERYIELVSAPGIVHYKATSPANKVRPMIMKEVGINPEDDSTEIEFVPSDKPLKESIVEEAWYDLGHDSLKRVTFKRGKPAKYELITKKASFTYTPANNKLNVGVGVKDNNPALIDNFGKQAAESAREVGGLKGASGDNIVRYRVGGRYEGFGDITADLDKGTGKPLKVTNYFMKDGKRSLVFEQTVHNFEKLPESEAEKALALPEKARKQQRAYTVGMTRAQAKAKLKEFKYFKPFWLGQSVGGEPLITVIGDPPEKNFSAVAYFSYGSEDQRSLEINEFLANSSDGRDNWTVKHGVKKRIINGYVSKIQTSSLGNPVRIIVKAKDMIVRIDGTGGQSEREMIKIIKDNLKPL